MTPFRRFVPLSLVVACLGAASTLAQDLEYRAQPKVLGRDAPGIGEWVADLGFEGVDAARASLSEVAGEKGLVIAVREADCPLSKKYGPRLVRLRDEWTGRGFGFLYLGVHSAEQAVKDVERYEFVGPYAVDPEGTLAAALHARTSTEVFVLDAARTLVYRGMIDDQYGLGFSKPEVGRHYLTEALRAVAAGDTVAVPATEAQGCLLEIAVPPPSLAEVTYHNRISRIVQDRCESCHRPGSVGPFPLTSYEEVARKKSMMKFVVRDRVMPPWFASEESGPFLNDTSLTDGERADLLAWIAAGAPEGDPAQAPLPRKRAVGWTIGEPDMVVQMPEPFLVPAEGVVDYQYFYAKTNLPDDMWVQAVEIRPSASQVVHHVLVFLESPEVREQANGGDRGARRALQEGVDGYFAGTVPGQSGLRYPAGSGKLLPAGSWLKFQLHYTPNGVEALDQSEIGLVFARGPVEREVHTTSAFNNSFTIPPFSFDTEVQGEYRFPESASILALFPHTHLRGNRFLYELLYPDGKSEELLSVPFYDFNWQLSYELATPVDVPAGTRLRATAWYDNSKENPANPNPAAAVGFGEQTFDEMMIGYVNWVATGPAQVAGDEEAQGGM